ncbi:MAG: hypothetical protein ABSF20_07630 [Smithella sp.]|jgi:hypothetical protein
MKEKNIKKKINLKYLIICDDIRHEVGNKISLIGIYNESITVQTIPFILPKLCFHLVFDSFDHIENIEMKIISPDNQELFSSKPSKVEKLQNNDDGKISLLDLILGNISFPKEGLYRLICIFDENKDLTQEIEFNVQKEKPAIGK